MPKNDHVAPESSSSWASIFYKQAAPTALTSATDPLPQLPTGRRPHKYVNSNQECSYRARPVSDGDGKGNRKLQTPVRAAWNGAVD